MVRAFGLISRSVNADDNSANHLSIVALTFENGLHPQWIPNLLDILDNYHISACLLLVGGLHGYNHCSFPDLRPKQLKDRLKHAQKAISNARPLPQTQVNNRIWYIQSLGRSILT
ncbi:MAG: hypothetical protein WBG66_23345 [Geitlerinemataceae cyanobacterium]